MYQKIEKMNIRLLEIIKYTDEEFIKNAENQIFLKENIKKKSEHILIWNHIKRYQKKQEKISNNKIN